MRHLGKNLVIALALVAAGFFVAWLRYRPYMGDSGAYTDGARNYEVAEDPVRFAVWDAPEEWAGAALAKAVGAQVEDRVARSPDGRWAVFAVGEAGLDMDLWIAELVDGEPVDPRPLPGVRSPADERAPSFGHGKLYFASDRAGGAGGLDLYCASFESGRAGVPERLPNALQSPADDTDPAAVPGSTRLVFASSRAQVDGSRDYDLYSAWLEGEFVAAKPEPLAQLNGSAQEREPAFTADGRGLFFASNRAGGAGSYDLYRSGRDDKAQDGTVSETPGWVKPVALRGLNGPGSERAPAPDPAGFELLLHSGEGDTRRVLRARSVELFQRPGRPVGWMDLLFLLLLLAVALFAWLAKRWEQLDVVYKCFLVSLVAHLLLALWLHQVHPESSTYVVADSGGERLQLRLVGRDPSGVRARNAEAGGAVELERSVAETGASGDPVFARTPGAEPGAGTEAATLSATAEPAAAAMERAQPLAPSALAEANPAVAEAPARSASSPESPAVEGPAPVAAERAGAAPDVALSQTDVSGLAPGATADTAPERASSGSSEIAETAPAETTAQRATSEAAPTSAVPAATALAAADAPSLESAVRSESTAAPAASAPTRQGGAPDLTLAGAERLDATAPTPGQSEAPQPVLDSSRRGLEGAEPSPTDATLARATDGSGAAPAQEAPLLEQRPDAALAANAVRQLEAESPSRTGDAPDLNLDGAQALTGATRTMADAAPQVAPAAERSTVAEGGPAAPRAQRSEAGSAPVAAAPRSDANAEAREAVRGTAQAVAALGPSGATMDTNKAPELDLGQAQSSELASEQRTEAQEIARTENAERRTVADSGPASATAQRASELAPDATELVSRLGPERGELPEPAAQSAPSASVAQLTAPAAERNAEAAPLALLNPESFAGQSPSGLDPELTQPTSLDSSDRPRTEVADGPAGAAEVQRLASASDLEGVAPDADTAPERSAAPQVQAALESASPETFVPRSAAEPALSLGGLADGKPLEREREGQAAAAQSLSELGVERTAGRAPAPEGAVAERMQSEAMTGPDLAMGSDAPAPSASASNAVPNLAQAQPESVSGRAGAAPELEFTATTGALSPTTQPAAAEPERVAAGPATDVGTLRPSSAAGLSRPRPSGGPSAPRFTGSPLAQLAEPKSSPDTDIVALAMPAGPSASAPSTLAEAVEPAPLPAPLPSAAAGLDRPRASADAGLRRPERSAAQAQPAGPRPGFTPLVLPAVPAPSKSLAMAPVESGDDWVRTPYQSRAGQQKIEALETYGGSEATEAAVQAGLAYLARKQDSSGFWGSAGDQHEKYRHVVIGKSGLSMLAFLGAGHTQSSGTEYSGVVGRAISFLLAVQDPSSGHFGNSGAYSHAIATYALGECLALTGDRRLVEPLQQAVAHILSNQQRSEDPRLHGGWGYYFPDGNMRLPDGSTIDSWPRASVTAWQVMALESAQLGGLVIPAEAFDSATEFLRGCWDARRGGYRYSHDPERLSGPYQILPGSTPASLFALSLLGEDIGAEDYRPARNFVTSRMPTGYRYRNTDRFVNRAEGNLYFWYYGTLALFRLGGRPWDAWNEAMKATLLPAQEDDGSWRPISIYATDYAKDSDEDRIYTTAMCVLSLEVYYRYFTPLLQVK